MPTVAVCNWPVLVGTSDKIVDSKRSEVGKFDDIGLELKKFVISDTDRSLFCEQRQKKFHWNNICGLLVIKAM